MNLSKDTEVVVVANAQAAGATDLSSLNSVDMQGFEAVTFIIQFGAIVSGAATSVKAQTSSDDSTFNDLESTSQTVADTDDNKAFIIDIVNPRERYLRPYVARATQNSTIESITAIKYRARDLPITQGSTIGGTELHASPAEGTA